MLGMVGRLGWLILVPVVLVVVQFKYRQCASASKPQSKNKSPAREWRNLIKFRVPKPCHAMEALSSSFVPLSGEANCLWDLGGPINLLTQIYIASTRTRMTTTPPLLPLQPSSPISEASRCLHNRRCKPPPPAREIWCRP